MTSNPSDSHKPEEARSNDQDKGSTAAEKPADPQVRFRARNSILPDSVDAPDTPESWERGQKMTETAERLQRESWAKIVEEKKNNPPGQDRS